MKTKQIKGAVDILLVCSDELRFVDNIYIRKGKIYFHKLIEKQICWRKLEVSGNWKFHCRLSEMTEDQAWPLVERKIVRNWNHKDYTNENSGYYLAKSSVQSLLEANGVLHENPVKDTMYNTDHSDDCYCPSCEKETARCDQAQKRWQEAEANVFNPETTLVFIKE